MMTSNFNSFVELNKKRRQPRSNGKSSKKDLIDDEDSSSSSSEDVYYDYETSELQQNDHDDDFFEKQNTGNITFTNMPINYEENANDSGVYRQLYASDGCQNSRPRTAHKNSTGSSNLEEVTHNSEREGIDRNAAVLDSSLRDRDDNLHKPKLEHDQGAAQSSNHKSATDQLERAPAPSPKSHESVTVAEASAPVIGSQVSDPLINNQARRWSHQSLPAKPSAARKSYRSQQTLPTLDETSDEVCGLLDLPKQRSQSMGSIDIYGNTAGSSRRKLAPNQKKATRLQKVKELQALASDLAQRGDEEEAIKVYRRALHVASNEVSKINCQINKQREKQLSKFAPGAGSPLPVAAIKSIQNRIQEDLLTMNERIGRIRLVMAVLYERVGDYENAVICCTEAIDVYKHQLQLKVDTHAATTDDEVIDLPITEMLHETGSSNTRGIASTAKTTKERLKEAQKVLHRLGTARELIDIRRKSIDEMTRIRIEINSIDSEITKNPEGSSRAKKRRDETYITLHEVAVRQLKQESAALGKSHPQIIDVLQVLSSLAEERHLMNDALQHLNSSLRIHLLAFGKRHHKTAQIYIKIARLYRTLHHEQTTEKKNGMVNLEDLTLENFSHAIEVLRQSKIRPTLLGSTLNDVAIIYMKRRQFSNAIELLKEALERYEENTEALTTSVAHDLIASQTESSGGSLSGRRASDLETDDTSSSSSCENDDKADSTNNGSCAYRSSSGNLSIEALQVWRNLGECYFQVHEYDDAKDAFANALEIQRSTRAIHDAVSELDLGIVGVEEGMLQLVDDSSIIDTLSRLGKCCLLGKRHQDAYVAHMECLELMNHLAVEEELYGNLRYDQILMRRQLLVKTLYCIASSCTELSKYDEALLYYSESVQHSRIASAFFSQQDNGSVATSSQLQKLQDSSHCALCFVGIGDVYLKQEKYPEALKTYNDSLKYCEMKGLPKDHSAVSLLLERKKETEGRITELPRNSTEIAQLEARALEEMTAGKLDESILTLTEAMGILRASFAQAKLAGFDSSEHLCAIARMLQTLASVFLEKGEEAKAERVFRDAVRLFKQSGSGDKVSL